MQKLRRLVDRLFPERQLFLRAQGHVRYLRLARGVQVGIFGLACVVALWALYASLMVVVNGRYMTARDAEFDRQQAAYQALSGQVAQYRDKVADLTRAVRERRSALRKLLGDGAPGATDRDTETRGGRDEPLARLEDALASVAALERAIEQRLLEMRSRLAAAAAERESRENSVGQMGRDQLRRESETAAALRRDLEAVTSRLEIAAAERRQAIDEVAALREQQAASRERMRLELERTAALRRGLATTKSRLETVSAARRQADDQVLALSDQYRVTTEKLRREAEKSAGLQEDLEAANSRLESALADRREGVNGRKAAWDQYEAARNELRQERQKTAALREHLDAAGARLEAALAERQRAVNEHLAVGERFEAAQEQLRKETAAAAALRKDLDGTRSRLEATLLERQETTVAYQALSDEFEAERVRLRQNLQNRHELAQGQPQRDSEKTALLRDNLEAVTERLEATTGELAKVAEDRERLRSRVAALERELSETTTAQQEVLARIARRTAGRIVRFERLVDLTGVDNDALMMAAGVPPIGQGGPFIAADVVDGSEDALGSAVAMLGSFLDRWQGLEHLLKRLPLAAPVNSYYVSSGYGLRRDPYSKKRSIHRGVDLAGPLRSPVFAPAPGVVTMAGRSGPNGKMIEIDHGMNIRTRYGHLTRILVKNGQKVDFHDKIGLTGSSGRSTGPHLHYEIWVDGRTYDPMRFIDAGRYAMQDVPAVMPVKLLHPVRPKPEPPSKEEIATQ